jgi:phage-related protein
VIFCVARERMVLLHGFVKKTQKTPAQVRRLALQRMKEVL